MGGPDYKMNYLATSCKSRVHSKSCTNKKCKRFASIMAQKNKRPISEAAADHSRVQEIVKQHRPKKPVPKKCQCCGRQKR
ncbi:MAG: hypothetical protein C0591_03180, partial [Marinilabiliales bacterium]